MKKILVIVAFATMFMATKVNAQELKFGAKGGLNIAKVSDLSIEDVHFDSRIAYHFGLMAEIKLAEKFAVQPELLYSVQGAKKKKDGVTGTLKLNYITIPVMAKYFVTDGLSLEAGPQLGFRTTAKLTAEIEGREESINLKDDIKGVDFGVNFGLGYSLKNLNFGIRYNLGLTDIAKDRESGDDETNKNGVFQVSIGYMF